MGRQATLLLHGRGQKKPAGPRFRLGMGRETTGEPLFTWKKSNKPECPWFRSKKLHGMKGDPSFYVAGVNQTEGLVVAAWCPDISPIVHGMTTASV